MLNEDVQIIERIIETGYAVQIVDSMGLLLGFSNDMVDIVETIDGVEACTVRVFDGFYEDSPKIGVMLFIDGELNDYSESDALESLINN